MFLFENPHMYVGMYIRIFLFPCHTMHYVKIITLCEHHLLVMLEPTQIKEIALPSTEHLICLNVSCYDKQIVMNVVLGNLIHFSIISLQLESVKGAWWLWKINCI